MKTLLVFLLSLVAASQAASPEPEHWRDLLPRPVDDEWQQLFGGLRFPQHARPAETFADKICAIQALIAKSNQAGLTVPVFLPPDLAAKRFEAIPASSLDAASARTGVALVAVPAIELFRWLSSQFHCEIVETEYGILFKHPPK